MKYVMRLFFLAYKTMEREKLNSQTINNGYFGLLLCRMRGAGGMNTVEKQDLIPPLLGQTMKEAQKLIAMVIRAFFISRARAICCSSM
jgi:hypothetical protein